MLMKTGLCAPAIEEISLNVATPYAKIIHDMVTEFLAAHGHLVVSNSKEMLGLVQLVTASSAVDHNARRIWSVLLQELRKQGRIQMLKPGAKCSLDEISAAEQLSETWSAGEMPEVAMVPSTLIKLIYPQETGNVTDPTTGVVLAGPAEFFESAPVQRIKSLSSESRLAYGGTRKSFWELVLRPLAKTTKEVTIFDRYLFSELTRRSHLPPSPTQPNEALVWLLRQIDAQGTNGVVVRLFAGTVDSPRYGNAQLPDTAHRALEILKNSWVRSSRGLIARVEITAGDWKQNGKLMPHDRHIRFGDNRAISIPAGLDRLKSPTVEDTAGMAWKYHWTSSTVAPLIESENELASGQRTGHIVL